MPRAIMKRMSDQNALSIDEPVRYVGNEKVDRRFYHGGIPSAAGVHKFQVLRANRAEPLDGDTVGWTYNHAPMLAFWQDKFYLQYVSNLLTEHVPPGRTMITTSADGMTWTAPAVLFPVIALPEIAHPEGLIKAGTPSLMHQRMGFYVCPDGRLLTLGFYSFCPHPRIGPNAGHGIGRVVREVLPSGGFGDIYTIRPNRGAGWSEANVPFPMYTAASDSGFVEACDALLADRLATLQWWEDERSEDGFYALKPSVEVKALSYYHRLDGAVVALWKSQLASLSFDDGGSWTPIAITPTIDECFAKTWGQRTSDGRYALAYNHSATRRNRFPMTVMSGADGILYDDLMCLHGEVSPMRYQGLHKNIGTQYVRGIAEGNGTPPDKHMWLTYSMNKEDIWVARTSIPLRSGTVEHADDSFETVRHVSELSNWNLHIPLWTPMAIVEDPFDRENRCLELRDEDPYEYGIAERILPNSRLLGVDFRLCVLESSGAALCCEVQDDRGGRPLSLRADGEWLSFDLGDVECRPIPFSAREWHRVTLLIDVVQQAYQVSIDGKRVHDAIPFADVVSNVQRLVFRTGSWRGDVRAAIVDGEPAQPGQYMEDLPGGDSRCALSTFLIDDVKSWTPRKSDVSEVVHV